MPPTEEHRHTVITPPHHRPVYANSAKVHVTDEEVIVQFALIRPQQEGGVLVAEVVLSPQHAIRLQRALDETLKKHFTRHLGEESGKR